jgi:ADP-ribose pyrophosphatase
MLMIQNYRHGAGTILPELPGGSINEKESGSDAARQELLEDTGYTSDIVESVNWFYTWF